MAMQMIPRPFHGTHLFPVSKLTRIHDRADLELTQLACQKRVVLLTLPATPSAAQHEVLQELLRLTSHAPMHQDISIVVVLPEALTEHALFTSNTLELLGCVCCVDSTNTLLNRLQLLNVNGSVTPVCAPTGLDVTVGRRPVSSTEPNSASVVLWYVRSHV